MLGVTVREIFRPYGGHGDEQDFAGKSRSPVMIQTNTAHVITQTDKFYKEGRMCPQIKQIPSWESV